MALQYWYILEVKYGQNNGSFFYSTGGHVYMKVGEIASICHYSGKTWFKSVVLQ